MVLWEARQGNAETAGPFGKAPFWRLLGPCWANFRTFFVFLVFSSHISRILNHHRFFIDFLGFGLDLGSIVGGFWDDCSMIFHTFC